jgi:hypothetical protein
MAVALTVVGAERDIDLDRVTKQLQRRPAEAGLGNHGLKFRKRR